jgi:hypothetical protein
MTRKANGPITLRGFSDALKDKMGDEIAEQRALGGPLTSYRKILEDSLTKRYASKTAAQKKDDSRIAKDLGEPAASADSDFLT